MAILASLSSRQFNPQTRTLSFSVDEAYTVLQVTMEHPDWPEGECVRISVVWPSGETGQFSTGGGVVTDKAGNPTGGTRVLKWNCYKPPNATTGEAKIQVLQTLTSAVLVEGF